ncbi:MAG TPA: prolyl aminopeptidase [Fimbriimonadaceae bacterium]|jgi:proline iminopeptidase
MPYPPIEPFNSGFLETGDGHRVYWEECGNPDGIPALILHGGPGSGCTPNQRRNFDPTKYRIVLFDQRNCGRSLPHASEADVDLSSNTTHHLIQDIETLRRQLKVDKWLIWGASWGSVLALAYAEQHPEHVSGLILMVMGTGRRMETRLMTEGFAPLFPEAWSQFSKFTERAKTEGSIIERYNELFFDSDPAIRFQAAQNWCDWETAIVPTGKPSPRFESPEYRLCFARIVTHYWKYGSWLEENQILNNADKLVGIPGFILQGRLDLSNLSGSPWELVARWPDCELEFFESGHEGNQAMIDRLIAVTDHFAENATIR